MNILRSAMNAMPTIITNQIEQVKDLILRLSNSSSWDVVNLSSIKPEKASDPPAYKLCYSSEKGSVENERRVCSFQI